MASALSILVVTTDADSAGVRDLWFGRLGYEAHTPTNPDGALRAASSPFPHLIVATFPAPRASGGTRTSRVFASRVFASRVFASRELALTPVLKVTSHAPPGEIGAAVAAEVSATLALPAPLDDLAGAVRRPVEPPYASAPHRCRAPRGRAARATPP